MRGSAAIGRQVEFAPADFSTPGWIEIHPPS